MRHRLVVYLIYASGHGLPPPARHVTRRPRQRSLTAKAIVLGHPATPILHQGRTAHLLPHRSSDHRGRYSTGQRLRVLEIVPGPTACHIILTNVQGPRQQYTLGQLTYMDARALGHTRLDHLWRHWITNHDQAWLGRQIEAGTDTEDEIARRFNQRWAGTLCWLLHFHVDHTAAPRLLANESGAPNQYQIATDGRWVYVPRSDERESDRGYTASDSRALHGELPALTDDEWDRHIKHGAQDREATRLTMVLTDRAERAPAERLTAAKTQARSKGYDIRDELRRYQRFNALGQTDKALRQLELLETRVFPSAA